MGMISVWQICKIWHRQFEICTSVYSLDTDPHQHEYCAVLEHLHQVRSPPKENWYLSLGIDAVTQSMASHLGVSHTWVSHTWEGPCKDTSSALVFVVSHSLLWGLSAVVTPKTLGWKLGISSLLGTYCKYRNFLGKSFWRGILDDLILDSILGLHITMNAAMGSHHNKLRCSRPRSRSDISHTLGCNEPDTTTGVCMSFYSITMEYQAQMTNN